MTDELRQEIELLKAQVAALTNERLPKVDRASKRRDRRQVIGGFGMFAIALLMAGTLSASALAGSNTVTTDDIVDGQVYGADIRDGTVTGTDIGTSTVTGTDVNESTLLITCPVGKIRLGDICYTNLRAAKNRLNAGKDCNDEKLRLPSIGEAEMIGLNDGVNDSMWTDIYYSDHSDDNLYGSTTNGTSTDPDVLWTALRSYRCVTTIGARP